MHLFYRFSSENNYIRLPSQAVIFMGRTIPSRDGGFAESSFTPGAFPPAGIESVRLS